jgi:hypothetical protein
MPDIMEARTLPMIPVGSQMSCKKRAGQTMSMELNRLTNL